MTFNNMDGRYVPTVRKLNRQSNGLQGLEQNKTLVFNDDDAMRQSRHNCDATRPCYQMLVVSR